jgi:hypothetical protein
MRGHLAQLNFGGMAQDLWNAAGQFWNQLRGAPANGHINGHEKMPVPVPAPKAKGTATQAPVQEPRT